MPPATLVLFFLALILKYVSISVLTVKVPSEIICVNGEDAVFTIEYSLDSGDTFNSVTLWKDFQNVFYAPAVDQGQVLPNGSFTGFYESRCITDYYYGRSQFTITLLHVSPSDEGVYTVQMTKNFNAVVGPVFTRLFVDFIPVTLSISGAPTQPVIDGAGPTVLACSANLGKPEALMVWSRRIGNAGPYTNITENVTTATISNGDGTTNGTSTLTVYLYSNDSGVQFRCQVSNRQGSSHVDTKTIIVTELILQETLNGGAVAAIVAGACLVVFIISMVIVAKRRGVTLPGVSRKSRTPKMSHDTGSIEMKKVGASSVEPDDGHVGPAVSVVELRCYEDYDYANTNGPRYNLAENVASELHKGMYVNVRVPIYEGLTEVQDGAAAQYTQLEADESSRKTHEYKVVASSQRT